MNSAGNNLDLIIRDLVIAGVTGAAAAVIIAGETAGWSFLISCLWLALNFTLLAWILSLLSAVKKPSNMFIFWLACAKIPASYLLLYWLYTADYLDTAGLTAGLLVLPLILVWRGLSICGRTKSEAKDN